MYIISQIIVAIGMIIDLAGKLMKTKRLLLLFMVLAPAFYSLSYFILENYLPAITQILLLIRAVWYLRLHEQKKSPKHYILPLILINSLFAVVLAFFWQGPINIVLIFVMLVSTVCLIFENMLFIRCSLICYSLLWISYDITVKGYVKMTCSIVTICLLIVSIIIYEILPRIREKRKIECNYDIKKILKICHSEIK